MENLIIIWSGPAWHTAWIYAGRALLEPLMFEWNMAGWIAAGGQLTTTTIVENFPGFPDGILWAELMNKMRQQSINSWVRIQTATVDWVDLTKKPFEVFVWDETYKTKSIIISTWATAKRLWIKWEDKFWQKWISACAICDWTLPIFRNQIIWVVWWWDSAAQEALYLTKYVSKVYLFIRRDILRASKVMQEQIAKNEKIEILKNTEVKEALWDNFLEKVVAYNNQTNKSFEVPLKWLFYAIWHQPNTEFASWQLDIDKEGYIITEPNSSKTSVEGVFAAGDVQDKIYKQAITAAGSGCMAALDAENYINW